MEEEVKTGITGTAITGGFHQKYVFGNCKVHAVKRIWAFYILPDGKTHQIIFRYLMRFALLKNHGFKPFI